MATATIHPHKPTITSHRTLKDHKPPTCREHPSRRQAGCRTCQARAAWYNRQRRRQVRLGTWEPLSPAEPIAEHIESLLSNGWTLRQIADRAGVDESGIRDVRDGQRTRGVTAVFAAALLGVTGPGPGRWLVPAIGTRRRVQALGAIGYSRPQIAQRLGVTKSAVDEWLGCERVTATTRDRVKALYDELSHIPGPSNIARSRARIFGYAPPLAWDEGTIDDPDAQPNLGETDDEQDGYDPLTVALAVDGRLTYDQIKQRRADLIEAVRRLAKRMSDIEIAHHLRWPGADDGPAGKTRGQAAVCKLRSREGIPAPDKFEAVYAYHTTRGRGRAARAAARKAA